MGFDMSSNAWKAPRINGWRYRKVKTFRSQHRADEYAESIKDTDCNSLRSKRLLPVVQQVRVGLGLGFLYRVCVPDRKIG